MTPTDLAEQEFNLWWTHTAERIAADIVTTAMDQQEAIRLLCRVSYFQGRIDEDCKLEGQLAAYHGEPIKPGMGPE